jgi:hypothetical protein
VLNELTYGNQVSVVTPDEEKYAQLRLEKQQQQGQNSE